MLLQTQSHALRPLTTAHLAQTMTLLGLSTQELRQKIESELASNPALELIHDRRCPNCHRRLPATGPCPICSKPQLNAPDQPVVFISARSDFRQYSGRASLEELPDEEWTAAEEDLPTYLLRQIAPELDQADRPLAAHLLTCLNDDGLLSVPLVEIARYQHVPLSRVESVLSLIQHADPIGVGSPTPQEALLVQLSLLAETRAIPALTERAIREGMDLLSRHAYLELGKLLGVSTSKAQMIARFISENLNPFPGRTHWGGVGQTQTNHQVYGSPDIVISHQNNNRTAPLIVEILSPISGTLRINSLFKRSLAQAPEDKLEEWQAALDQASLLVKCLQQRNHTLVRLMQRLVVLQREFILKGDAYLKPVTRAHLSIELEVHESTVSRAVSGKSLQLPNGRIVPLSKLFDRSLHIRTALRQIVAQERKPLSDTEISELLHKQGYQVARRTVAKYRTMEGILPARFRHASPV
jgi:RNA polymerase sigma-54 factor